MTISQSAEQAPSKPPADLRPPALVVRMSAIGDTLIATRTHALLEERGYAPYLLTQANNSSLLQCMPLLSGACLISESDVKFFLRNLQSQSLQEVSQNDFSAALRHGNEKIAADLRVNKHLKCLHVLDLQNTARSRRAVNTFANCFAADGFNYRISKVAKNTLWRLLLVLLSFFSRQQLTPRTPPAWLQRRLKPVHALQRAMIERLPEVPNRRLSAQMSEGNPSVERIAGRVPLIALSPADWQTQSYVVFVVGASYRLKSWPRENYRALLAMILENTSLKVVLCGGPEDQDIGHYLAFPAQERVANLIGKTSLAETLGLIKSAVYVVTGDSFASHAADLLGTPVSVIFGATHPLLGFAPAGSQATVHHSGLSCSPCSRHGQGECRFRNIRCLTSIKPEEVFSKIEQIWRSSRQIANS